MTKLSIIVPVYNVEKYLPQCLNSLIKQTLKDIEIICVNDGSTDNSSSIIEEFAKRDERIKVYNQHNQGQSVARNFALAKAVGEYVGFVDSDDWVDLDYFEKLYCAAKKNECDIACAGFKKFKIFKGKIRKKFKKEIVIKDINSKVETDNLPQDNYIWNKIYRRESFIKTGINFPENRYFEDVAVLIKILYYLNDMVTVPNTYYHYRKRKGSTVRVQSKKHIEDLYWARNEMVKFAKEKDIKITNNKKYKKRIYYKIFGITIVKIYFFDNTTKYKLLGFIPFISKIIR